MISKSEATQLKQLMQSPQWGALENLINSLRDKAKSNKAAADTEWDTIKNVLVNEGRERAYAELIQEMYAIIQA